MPPEILPNGWAALIELVKAFSALGSAAIAAYLVIHTRKQNTVMTAEIEKQGVQNTRIETLVNGNLHREQEENTRLRALLEANGISADAKE